MAFSLLQQQALGLSHSALSPVQQQHKSYLLHQEALPAWQQLKQAAAEAGFNLSIASSYRDFYRQSAIWNAKAQGLKPLFDRQGKRLDYHSLNTQQLCQAILYWSAAPGCSRHHWGSDIDVFDANTLAEDQVQLSLEEVQGPCAALHQWLDERIAKNQSFGFFRPFSQNASQVCEEKWHLSFMPVAYRYESLITPELLIAAWQIQAIELYADLEQQAPAIVERYVQIDYPKLVPWLQHFI